MMGRSNNKEGIENNFPSFMANLANRNSCVNFNEKSLTELFIKYRNR